MAERGYLDGKQMTNAFNLLRSNDLIWPYVINNYLRGKTPFPFDLLHWNSDATRMPAANHSFYLRNCYLDNTLTKGEMTIDGMRLDLKKVMMPVYNLATREDHIAPAKSAFLGAKFFGGPVKFVLSGSGHIAGDVNPVAKAGINSDRVDTKGNLGAGWRATDIRGMVARLVAMAQGPACRNRSRAPAGRPRPPADRRCPRQLCKNEVVSRR